ncbi:hemerythrin domain-containing protein [Streptomyces sp. NPDC048172]|uniref:hemerythrin domain-containing protein n=1 Tax=Streptomyces sp. NPDC048172 TaxID=3365505 RepID=UPI003722BC90
MSEARESGAAQVNTTDLVLAHRLFRKEFAAVPGLVRRVPAGDKARAGTVGAHLAGLLHMLDDHHKAEDEIVWPRLNSDTDVPPTTMRRMEEQHERIAEDLEEIERLLPVWRESAAPEAGDRLAAAVATMTPALAEHLDDEEKLVLPLVHGRFTQREWDRLSERGRDAVPKNKQIYMLGELLASADDQQRADYMRRLPPPVRLLWPVVGRLVHRRQYRALHGAA